MDEDIAIINSRNRNEKIKDFFINNKKTIIISLSSIIVLIFSYFIYQDYNNKNKIKLANKYNTASINFFSGNKTNVEKELIEIINTKDKTYSPLALYFLMDNNIIKSNDKINELFDIIIYDTKLDKEIRNLVIYKKALFNSEFESENNLIKILNPILNSTSIWESHALYLLGEYFYSKNEKKKAKEFFEKILNLENGNLEIKKESQKRIQRDLSE
tara:strand:- start:2899 stop:3543 length:645 start_codon:yes stop_codon:yes gene_type:complete